LPGYLLIEKDGINSLRALGQVEESDSQTHRHPDRQIYRQRQTHTQIDRQIYRLIAEALNT